MLHCATVSNHIVYCEGCQEVLFVDMKRISLDKTQNLGIINQRFKEPGNVFMILNVR